MRQGSDQFPGRAERVTCDKLVGETRLDEDERREVAERRKAWVVLYTHDMADTPSPYGCTPAALARLADEAVARGFEVVTVAEGARRAA